MKRDRRLLIAMLLFAVSLVIIIQAAMLMLHHQLLSNGYEGFPALFPVDPPAKVKGPKGGEYGEWVCFDCGPDPVGRGLIGVAVFFVGWFILAYAWWKPRRFKEPTS